MELSIINTQKELAVKSLFSDYETLRENSEENYEFINGEIIKMYSPSIKHQDIVFSLAIEIRKFFRNSKCKVMISPTDICLEKEDIKKETCVIPDISVMCNKGGFNEKRYNGVPTIIVEVLSSNWADDMIKKLKLYEEYGVSEYWIIDPNSESFMVYSYDLEKRSYNHTLQEDNELCSKLFADLKIDMKEVFGQI
ncbi:Uma2 family endonuclease [Clostridium gasigenes]|nr:Uma2 family endonuclease [Clostridium gasigenes]MBU3109468.1 Uma2 family endonuclease [Clostridium gasigenes]